MYHVSDSDSVEFDSVNGTRVYDDTGRLVAADCGRCGVLTRKRDLRRDKHNRRRRYCSTCSPSDSGTEAY